MRTALRPGPARRVSVVLVATVVTVGSLALVVRAFRDADDGSRPTSQTASAPFREFPVGGEPGELLVAAGSVWIAGHEELLQLDPDRGVVRRIQVQVDRGGSSGAIAPQSQLAFGDGDIWLAAEPFFVGVDASTGDLDRSFAWESGVTRLTFHDGRIHYGGSAEGNGQVVAIDPEDQTFDAWAVPTSAYPAVVLTENWIWAADGGTLARRALAGDAVEVVEGVDAVDSVAGLDDAVWVTGGSTLWKVDAAEGGTSPSPQSGFPATADAVEIERTVSPGAEVATGGGRVWLLEEGSAGTSMTELDPETGTPLDAPTLIPRTGPSSLAVGDDGAPWISFRNDGVVVGVAPPAGSSDATATPEAEPSLVTPGAPYLTPEERWAPKTHAEASSIVMPVTFPNGTSAELVYDPELVLETKSATPGTYVDGPGDCGAALNGTRHDPRLGWVRGSEPIRSHQRADGSTVELWNGTRSHEPHDYLIYRAGSWSVMIPCRNGETLDQHTFETWAEGLHVQESPDGLLVVDADAPLDARRYGEWWVQFNDADVVIEVRATTGCEDADPDVGTGDGVIQWCVDPEHGVYVYATSFAPSGKAALDAVVDSLEIRSVDPS